MRDKDNEVLEILRLMCNMCTGDWDEGREITGSKINKIMYWDNIFFQF